MNKKTEFKIEDNDLDKVSGGSIIAYSQHEIRHFLNPYHCERCSYPLGEVENVKAGDECPLCHTIQTLNPTDNGGL